MLPFSFDDVESLIRETAEKDILPRYQSLTTDQVQEKTPGDVVTIADQDAENRLSAGLARILSGSLVVGVEAVFDDVSVLDRLNEEKPVWIIDPLDGTGNFAAGLPTFAVMVSLMQGGVTQAGWIFDPLGDRIAVASLGNGCQINGEKIKILPAPEQPSQIHAGILTKFLPDDLEDDAEAAKASFATVTASMCAGHEYLDLLTGKKHCVLYYRTLPWDHTAGALMYQEAGGIAARLDGTEYHPVDGRFGLLLATDPIAWEAVHAIIVPSIEITNPIAG